MNVRYDVPSPASAFVESPLLRLFFVSGPVSPGGRLCALLFLLLLMSLWWFKLGMGLFTFFCCDCLAASMARSVEMSEVKQSNVQLYRSIELGRSPFCK